MTEKDLIIQRLRIRVAELERMAEGKRCRSCDKTDGFVYTSLPPMVRCTVTGEFHYLSDECDLTEDDAVLNGRSEWIPCKDRLPEEGVDVLISYRYKEGEGDTSHMYIDIASYGTVSFGGHKLEGIKEWGQPFAYFASNYEVVAWMPLPDPYEERTMEEFMYGQDPGNPEDGSL